MWWLYVHGGGGKGGVEWELCGGNSVVDLHKGGDWNGNSVVDLHKGGDWKGTL